MRNYLFSALAFLLFAGANLQAQTCPEPTNIQINRTSDSSATIYGSGSDLFDLYIKPAGDPAPTATTPPRTGFNDLTFPYTSNVLGAQFGYDIYVRSQCADSTSAWTGPFYLAPYVACDLPADLQVVRTSDVSATFTTAETEGVYDYYAVAEGGVAPAGVHTGPNSHGRNDIQLPHERNDLNPNLAYDIYFRMQCSQTQVTEWVGPFNLPLYEEPAPICEAPSNIVVTRDSPTTASVDGADASFVYQGTANLAGNPIRPYPMYGMDAISMPHTQGQLNPDFAYDVWFRTVCGDGTFSEWVGPYYVPVYEEPAPVCVAPENVVLTRTSHSTATFDGADPSFTYQGSANRAGKPLRPYPMYGMEGMTIPHTQTGLNAAFDYDVWLRTECPDGTFTEWTGPFYLPTYGAPVARTTVVTPNPTTGMVRFEGFDAVSAQVINFAGRTEATLNVVNNEINISNLTPGNYVINAVDAKGNVQSFKVVKK